MNQTPETEMNHSMRKAAAAALLTGLASSTWAQDPTEALANRLVQMRGQVDELQSELNLKREEYKNRMTYLTAQLTETEANRDREALRVQQLEQELEQGSLLFGKLIV